MGTCSICGEMVCSECFRTVFNQVICDGHADLEDESAWELVGLYTSEGSLAERRYYLEEQAITSINVETDDETFELYVSEDEKEDAYAALVSSSEETLYCPVCQIQYAREMQECPLCGAQGQE
ncbi:MAG: hypothetical protein GTN64_09495 [Candidatus Latescibacteria bacterium]|nr:hypothetical protein [Candidatus Latescibacterota bacterium]NIO78831.1 hypothetical protein [Candidatus Latescibacterota bacterium]